MTLPSLSSFAELEAKIKTLTTSHRALCKKLDGYVLSSNNTIAMYLSQLLSCATELSSDIAIVLHQASGGGNDTLVKALYVRRGATVKKIQLVLQTLRQLQPLSSDPAVRAWNVPDLGSITGPESIDNRIGTIVVVPGDVEMNQLLDVFNSRRAAHEELHYCTSWMILSVHRTILQQLLHN